MKIRYVLLAMLPVFLVGCKESVDVVDSKSVARWQAIVDKDYDKAYSYIADSYQKIEDLNTYRLRIAAAQVNTQWQGAEFRGKICDESQCEVKLGLKYKYVFPKASMGSVESTAQIMEKWIKEDGEWKILPSAEQNLQP